MVTSAVSVGAYLWTKDQIHTIPTISGSGSTPGGAPDIVGRCAERACNYLLLGSDSRKGLTPEELEAFGTDEFIGGQNRSDTIILVHTRPGQKQAIFLSFPRDLWIDIPGVGEGRINSAFEDGIDGGGAQLVARTVKNLTGMQVHHVMYVSLLGFQRVVDALGGVDMCVPYPMKDPLALLDIPAGCQHFDGITALGYVRTRHQPCDTIPDFARISRQQQFMRAVIAKLLRPGEILRLPELVPQLLQNLVVDEGLNPAELVYLAGRLQGVGTENADFRAVPTIPEGIYDADGTYLSVVKMIQPDADELFRRLREGRSLGDLGTDLAQTPPSPANIVTSVVSSRRRSGSRRGPHGPHRGRVQHLAGHRRRVGHRASEEGLDDPVPGRRGGDGEGRRHVLHRPGAGPRAGRIARRRRGRRRRRDLRLPGARSEREPARRVPRGVARGPEPFPATAKTAPP